MKKSIIVTAMAFLSVLQANAASLEIRRQDSSSKDSSKVAGYVLVPQGVGAATEAKLALRTVAGKICTISKAVADASGLGLGDLIEFAKSENTTLICYQLKADSDAATAIAVSGTISTKEETGARGH